MRELAVAVVAIAEFGTFNNQKKIWSKNFINFYNFDLLICIKFYFIFDVILLSMPINSRTKGASYERKVVGILNDFFLQNDLDVSCKRNLDQYQTKGMCDIVIPNHAIECKHHKQGNWYKQEWWDQVCESSQGRIPVLVFKFNRVPTRVAIPLYAINTDWDSDNDSIAVLSLEQWLEILKKNWHSYGSKIID